MTSLFPAFGQMQAQSLRPTAPPPSQLHQVITLEPNSPQILKAQILFLSINFLFRNAWLVRFDSREF